MTFSKKIIELIIQISLINTQVWYKSYWFPHQHSSVKWINGLTYRKVIYVCFFFIQNVELFKYFTRIKRLSFLKKNSSKIYIMHGKKYLWTLDASPGKYLHTKFCFPFFKNLFFSKSLSQFRGKLISKYKSSRRSFWIVHRVRIWAFIWIITKHK